jgi:hypothetical protein
VSNETPSEPSQLDLLLPFIMPANERKHLENLAQGRTRNYTASRVLRDELRRIRGTGLIAMRSGHTVGELRDGMDFDLADYV